MTAYTNVTADDWVMADPVPEAGECARCGRAVQRCQHAPGCQGWLDADDSVVCEVGIHGIHDPLVRHVRGTGCCCYPEPCAGHLPEWTKATTPRHPWGIPCNEPSFHGNGV